MKAILQRVREAKVKVDDKVVGQCANGWFILLGVTHDDTREDILSLTKKIISLRAFNDENQKMNLDIKSIKGSILVVSQFTLYGDLSKGNRPSFLNAAKPEHAKELYEAFIAQLKEESLEVESGVFGANMQIYTTCDGPVSFVLETKKS